MYKGTQGELRTATPCPYAPGMSTFTCHEWVALLQLRRRYGDGQDEWTARELEYLRFLRWLRNTGRVES